MSQHQCEVSHHLEQTLLVPGTNFRSSNLPQFQCWFQFFLKNIGHVVICIDSSSGWNNMKFGQTVNANRAPYHDFGTWFDTADAWYLVWLGPPHNIVLSVWDMEQIFCRLIAKDVLLPVFSGQMFEFVSKLQSSLPLHFRSKPISRSFECFPFLLANNYKLLNVLHQSQWFKVLCCISWLIFLFRL